jgi:hypothetical protein
MTTGIIPGVTFQDFQPDPANQLLCDLLRWDESHSASFDNQMAVMNWPEFSQLAVRHSLAGVVYKRLRALAKQSRAPEAALDELRPFYLAQASASMPRTHWLGQILRELHARGIPVIVLKGAYLAEVVYADSAARPMSDIDLLVRQEDLEAAAQTLTDLGYQTSKEFWLDFELQVGQHLPPFMKTGAPPIEVHWRLLEPDLPFEIDQAGLWKRACPVKIAGQPALGLYPEDLLLHLCLHATIHRFQNGLRATYDIAATIMRFRESLDWNVLVWRARDWRAERALFLWLWLAADLFGAAVPAGVLQELKSIDFGPEQAALTRRLVFANPDEQSNIPLHLAELVQAPSTLEKIRLIWQQLFLSPQIMARAYPVKPGSWKVLLYYPVRWWNLFMRAVQPVWGLLRRGPQTLAPTQRIVTREHEEDQLIAWIERKPSNQPTG